jgi:F-type H+-transporting ATPase subunit b
MATPVTTAPDVAHNAASGTFPPFAAETFPSQLLWLVLTFGFLYWFMSKVVVPGLGGVIADRTSRIAKDLDEAAAAKSQAEAAGVAYEQALSDARNKAQGIARSTRDTVNASSEARRKAIEAELSGKIAASEATIEKAKASAMANVESIAADAAGAIVQRLTGSAPPASDVATAVKTAMKV